jgi:hypothetical protein
MSTKKTKTVITTIRYKDCDGDYVYLASSWKDIDEWRVNSAYQIEEAQDVSEMSSDEQMELYIAFSEYYEGEAVELVRITTTIEEDDLTDVDEGEYRELRQRIALRKLNDTDIRALGIMNIATYIKTKYT